MVAQSADAPRHLASLDLALARSLVKLDDAGGKSVPLRVDHPKKRTFQGVPADPRFVVIATPALPLRPGEDYTVSAADRLQTRDPALKTASLSVASAAAVSTHFAPRAATASRFSASMS